VLSCYAKTSSRESASESIGLHFPDRLWIPQLNGSFPPRTRIFKGMKTIRPAILAFVTLTGFGQTAPPPQFEVASIRPSAPAALGQVGLGLHIDGSQVSMRQFALKDEIAVAFNLKQYQVSGPDWLATEKFDIVAKLPEGAPRNQVREMLQALLLDRFQMKTHHETKDFSVYAVVVAKSGLKMKEAPPDPRTLRPMATKRPTRAPSTSR